MLDYENKFCKKQSYKPISKVYFATQDNGGDQFMLFITLTSWLLSVNNHTVSGWNKYDSPMTAAQNVIGELRKLGIELDVQPAKLIQGYGEGVCTVLLSLCQMGVENRVKFKKPVIKDGDGSGFGGGEEDDMDMGDEFEGQADVNDMMQDNMAEDIDDIDEDYEFAGQVAGGGKQVNEEDLLQ